MKKKVLIIGPSPFKSKGGIATVIEEIKKDKKLKELYDIDIFESYIDGNKIKVIIYSIFAFLKFLLIKKNYDIYHIHAASRGSTFRKGWYVNYLKKHSAKVIFHIHGAEYIEFFNEISKRKKNKVINILKKADMVLALSQEWKKKFDNMFGLTNCYVLENGIDQERLMPAFNSNIKKNQTSFVALGRLGERKGTYDIIEAVKLIISKVPDIRCYLAGDGEIDKVKSLIHKYQLENNVIVSGWVNFEKKLSLLKQSSTVLLPSYNEGLPMSVLEGMACGKAIIGSTVGAIPEVVGENNGILVEPGDIKALAIAMECCCKDTELMKKFNQNNIKKIQEKFSMVRMHKILSEYYDYL